MRRGAWNCRFGAVAMAVWLVACSDDGSGGPNGAGEQDAAAADGGERRVDGAVPADAAMGADGAAAGEDAGRDAAAEGAEDAGFDAGTDAATAEDAGFDAGMDAATADDAAIDGGEDAGLDAGDMLDMDAAIDGGDAQDAGGDPDDPAITLCSHASDLPLEDATCQITAGNTRKLLTGDVLQSDRVLRGGQVLIDEDGFIRCVACDCSAQAAGATQIDCPTGVISPGLINAHDHITYAQNAPANVSVLYEHRNEWRTGAREQEELTVAGGASNAQILLGELRGLLVGTTSTLGAGGATGLLRNLDNLNQQGGLLQAVPDLDTFPLGDLDGELLVSGCGYPDITTQSAIANRSAYIAHVSEGLDQAARNELTCLSMSTGGGQDLVQPQSAFVHGIALTATDYALMANDGTALIWSPRSNVALYGDTTQAAQAARQGVLVALGTDWMATGSMNLQRELRCAKAWSEDRFGGAFDDRELFDMVTLNAALASGTEALLGRLAVGLVGDVVIFDGALREDHAAVVDAEPEDVVLVLRAGLPLHGDDALMESLRPGCEMLAVCGRDKRVCAQLDTGVSLANLQASVPAYGALACDTPPNEPACEPARDESVNGSTVYTGVPSAGDADGDGVADGSDNCSAIWNPVRPVDSAVQRDYDGDGLGDACDPCPLDAAITHCSVVDAHDPDADGVHAATDNCPLATNDDQVDMDHDGHGDACDACPSVASLGNVGCPVSIYEIKSGAVALDTTVSVPSALVTASDMNSFFIQVKETESGYLGAELSGLFVFKQGHGVVAGDRVALRGALVQQAFGRRQLSQPQIELLASGEVLPAAVLETTTNLATGSARAEQLEGVLVVVQNVTVTDISLGFDEFLVKDTSSTGVRVNDLFYPAMPFPMLSENFSSITGVLELRNGDMKIEPRGATDIVP